MTFKDLEVIGMGGFKINVRRFPDAIKEFLMQPLIMVMMRMEKFKPKPKTSAFAYPLYVRPTCRLTTAQSCTSSTDTPSPARWSSSSVDRDQAALPSSKPSPTNANPSSMSRATFNTMVSRPSSSRRNIEARSRTTRKTMIVRPPSLPFELV